MSHKPTPYSPNFPASQGYAPPEDSKKESYPMTPPLNPGYAHQSGYPQSGYPQPGYPGPPPGPAMPMPPPGPPVVSPGIPMVMPPPGAQPLPGMAPGMQQGFQPGYQPGLAPGYPHPQVYQTAIVDQPQPGGWTNTQQGSHSNPPGLEYLSVIDHILVKQEIEFIEAFIGFETNNKYSIQNNLGQKIYYAVEKTNCCIRNMCGSIRPFTIKVLDNFGKEIIRIRRPLRCDSCLCPCCLQTIEVSAPPDRVIGSIEQKWTFCKPQFDVKDEFGTTVLKIKGPFCPTNICFRSVDFRVMSCDGETQVGKISKQWGGMVREVFTDSDSFGISFPMDLDVKIKAVLIGACFLIDFMFYERNAK